MSKRTDKQNKEVWKPVKGYEGLYKVSNFGRIKSLSRKQSRTERILKNVKKKQTGYEQVRLSKNNEIKEFLVHRLVAEHFIEKPYGKDQINHKDGDRANNHVENLEWVTPSENTKHAYESLGITPCQKGRTGGDHNKSRPVLQISLEGEAVKEWGSAMDAVREGGFNSSSISRCCNGINKTHKGFKWKFKDE